MPHLQTASASYVQPGGSQFWFLHAAFITKGLERTTSRKPHHWATPADTWFLSRGCHIARSSSEWFLYLASHVDGKSYHSWLAKSPSKLPQRCYLKFHNCPHRAICQPYPQTTQCECRDDHAQGAVNYIVVFLGSDHCIMCL